MSIKSLSKTRWKIEPNRVTIYPYGVFYVFTAIIAVFFTALIILYITYQNTTITGSLPIVLFFILMVVAFWGFGGTCIEFDNTKGTMRKMLMGFLPVTTIPFARLQGINAVTTLGTYNYRLFQKEAKYGKGIVVSSGYTKSDDLNAIAFVNEAVSLIHSYLDLYDSPADHVAEQITDYRFFEQEGHVYAIKNRKIGAIVFGAFFLVIGVFLLIQESNSLVAKVIIAAIVGFLALIFFNAAYTKITFDPATRTIQRTGLVKFFNRQYNFGAFAGIQTVRRSINFVYAGTDINMYFDVPDKNGKQDVFTVTSIKKSTDIERFIQELYQLMGI